MVICIAIAPNKYKNLSHPVSRIIKLLSSNITVPIERAIIKYLLDAIILPTSIRETFFCLFPQE